MTWKIYIVWLARSSEFPESSGLIGEAAVSI